MGKGGSGLAATGLTGQEVAGEYRRAVADADRGGGAGTADADQAAPVGETVTLLAGLMICSTSSTTRRCWWWHGVGSGVTRGSGPAVSTALRRSMSPTWRNCSSTFAKI